MQNREYEAYVDGKPLVVYKLTVAEDNQFKQDELIRTVERLGRNIDFSRIYFSVRPKGE